MTGGRHKLGRDNDSFPELSQPVVDIYRRVSVPETGLWRKVHELLSHPLSYSCHASREKFSRDNFQNRVGQRYECVANEEQSDYAHPYRRYDE
jgi:hypothetical protein